MSRRRLRPALAFTAALLAVSACRSPEPPPPSETQSPRSSRPPAPPVQTPNAKVPDCSAWGGVGTGIGFFSARSRHPGGVNVCLADGSVRFIKDTIADRTWFALATRTGGEVLSADSY